MASPNLARVLRNPGRWVLAPTSLSTAFPHGGTELGLTQGCEVEWGIRYSDVVWESFGRIEESQVVGEFPAIACFLDQWDDDLISRAFPRVATGTSPTGNVPNMARIDGSVTPKVVVPMGKLLYVSDDAKGKCVLIRRPLPKIKESSALQLAADDDSRFAFVFVPVDDDSGKASYSVGHLWELSL